MSTIGTYECIFFGKKLLIFQSYNMLLCDSRQRLILYSCLIPVKIIILTMDIIILFFLFYKSYFYSRCILLKMKPHIEVIKKQAGKQDLTIFFFLFCFKCAKLFDKTNDLIVYIKLYTF